MTQIIGERFNLLKVNRKLIRSRWFKGARKQVMQLIPRLIKGAFDVDNLPRKLDFSKAPGRVKVLSRVWADSQRLH